MKFSIRDLCLLTVCAALAVNSCRLENRINQVERYTDVDAKAIVKARGRLDRHSQRILGVEVHNRWQEDRLRLYRGWLEEKEGTPVSSRPDEIRGCPEAVRQPASP